MKFFQNFGERLIGLVVSLVTIVTIAIGGIIGLIELPRYLKMRSK